MKTKAERIKDLLSRPEGASNKELSSISLRYGATIFNLRREGYTILDKRIGNDGLWRYKLVPKACKHPYTIDNGAKCANCHADLYDVSDELRERQAEDERSRTQQSFDLYGDNG